MRVIYIIRAWKTIHSICKSGLWASVGWGQWGGMYLDHREWEGLGLLVLVVWGKWGGMYLVHKECKELGLRVLVV